MSEDNMVVTAAIPNGARMIARPSISMKNHGANSSSIMPFNINVPNPKVKTKNGIAILVKIGHKIEFIKPMNNTKRNMSSNELISTPKPKKLIKYIPRILPMNTIKLLLKLLFGVCFSLIISILIHHQHKFKKHLNIE